MLLLNCRSCDDIFTLTDKERTCACGTAHGHMEGNLPVLAGGRLLELDWEDYDRSVVRSKIRLTIVRE